MSAGAPPTPLQGGIRLFAPAKINWVLTVEGKRSDGYHDIHTVFQALSHGDELVCRPAAPDRSKDCCTIRCNDPAVPTGEDNLIVRAWSHLRREFPGRVGGLAVDLTKRIPAGAGLAGGSADAAAALVAVNRLYGLGLGPAELEGHAAAIGSDCAFFIRGGAAQAAGRGERLTRLRGALPPLWLVVVYPGFPSSTAAAYARLRPEHWENGRAGARAAEAILRGDAAALRRASRNIFSEVFLATDERYRRLAGRLREEGLEDPLLSGSGSAMFAHAAGAAPAREACQRLRQEYPLAFPARPRRTGVGVLPSS